MFLPWLFRNWKAALVGLIVTVVLGFIGSLQVTIARQGQQIGDLRQEIGRMVPAVSEEDLQALLKSVEGMISREVGAVKETLRLVEVKLGKRTVERVIERRAGPAGPPGHPGQPGPPGPSGTPLIAPERQPEARREAIEKIYLTFDDGHLVACATAGLGNPNVVELLRAPTGALSSTSPCLGRIADTFTLQEPPTPPVSVPSRWKAVAAYHVAGGGWGLGVGYTLASVWRVDLDALAVLWPTMGFGPGISYRVTEQIGVGVGYLWAPAGSWSLAAYAGWRF